MLTGTASSSLHDVLCCSHSAIPRQSSSLDLRNRHWGICPQPVGICFHSGVSFFLSVYLRIEIVGPITQWKHWEASKHSSGQRRTSLIKEFCKQYTLSYFVTMLVIYLLGKRHTDLDMTGVIVTAYSGSIFQMKGKNILQMSESLTQHLLMSL